NPSLLHANRISRRALPARRKIAVPRRDEENSDSARLHGGPGRTRTSNQTVMSAPMWRHAYFDFAEFLDGTAVLTNEIANDWRRSFPAIASAAVRMCAGW